MTHALLVVAVIAHLAPEHIAEALGHTVVAWETVMYGLESTFLWLAVYSMSARPLLWIVCCYGVFESIQRPMCRLLHPMGTRLVLPPGQTVCEAAGVDTASLSAIAAGLVVSIVVQRREEWL